jgi:hypothetical protein
MNDHMAGGIQEAESQSTLTQMEATFSGYAREKGYVLDDEYLALCWRGDDLGRWLVARDHNAGGYQILGVTVLALHAEDHTDAVYLASYRRSDAIRDPNMILAALRAMDRIVSGMGLLDVPPFVGGEREDLATPRTGPEKWKAIRYRTAEAETEPADPNDTPGYVRAGGQNSARLRHDHAERGFEQDDPYPWWQPPLVTVHGTCFQCATCHRVTCEENHRFDRCGEVGQLVQKTCNTCKTNSSQEILYRGQMRKGWRPSPRPTLDGTPL